MGMKVEVERFQGVFDFPWPCATFSLAWAFVTWRHTLIAIMLDRIESGCARWGRGMAVTSL